MHDVINFLKGAVARAGAKGAAMSCYSFGTDLVTARSEGLQAGVAMESAVAFLVPAVELEMVLARMKEVQSLSFDGDILTLKGGRVKASIQCIMDDAELDVPDMDIEWLPVPAGFVEALAVAGPFINDTGWNAGVRLMGDSVTAITNVAGVVVTVPGMNVPSAMTLPAAAVDFLISQGAPTEFACTGGALVFRWSDGRWARAQVLAAGFPPTVDRLFDRPSTSAWVDVTDDWRGAMADAAALAHAAVEITATHIRSGKGAAQSEVSITSDLPDDHVSRWMPKAILPVIACATKWQPGAWPDPAPFVGDNLRGIVLGVR